MLHRGFNCLLARAMDGRIMRRGIISSCQSAATPKIVKALLVTSLTHVSSAIASTFTFTFEWSCAPGVQSGSIKSKPLFFSVIS